MINKLKNLFCLFLILVIGAFALCTIIAPAYADTPPATGTSNSPDTSSADNIADNSNCKYSELQKKYMDGSTCWYCLIVGKMTGAYLYAASLVIPTVKTLSLMVLRYGFLIWLALFILKQVSSLSPVSSGKFLQELLIMGFKVLLATLIINNGIPFLNAYLMTPIIDTGIDIGNSIFNELAGNMDIENLEGGK